MSGKYLRVLLTTALVCFGLSACNDSSKGQTADDPATVVLHVNDSTSTDTSGNATSVDLGKSVRLTWSSANANFCTASGGLDTPPWKGAQAVNSDNNGVVVGPLTSLGAYTFTLSCTGAGGSGAATKTVTVGVPAQGPTTSLSVSPNPIQPGNSATLSWSSTSAASCNATGDWLAPGTRPVASPANGESTGVLAEGSYTYTLTCTGAGGTSTDSETLVVSPSAPPTAPTLSFQIAPELIQPGQAATLTWTSNATAGCLASGAWQTTGAKAASGSESTGTKTAGTYGYTLTCSNTNGGTTTQTRTLFVSATAPVPAVSVTVSPNPITVGQSAIVSFTTTNVTVCTATGDWSGTTDGTSGTYPTGTLTTPGPRTYNLSCTGPGGTAQGSATLSVLAASTVPVVTFSANPTVVAEGGSSTLTWSSTAATSCAAYGDWTGSKPTSGTQSVGPFNVPGTYNYVLQCSNATGQTDSKQVHITVTPSTSTKPVVGITAAPLTVTVGGSTTLSWTASSNSVAPCVASGDWSGDKPLIGSQTFNGLTPAGFRYYVLTCSNAAGSTHEGVIVSVVTPAPALDLRVNGANSATIGSGVAASLTWASTNATACTASASPASATWTGSKAVSNNTGESTGALTEGSYAYSLSCTGPGGSVNDTVQVTVNAAPPPPAATLDLKINGKNGPLIIPSGGHPTLSWTSTNATSCTASGSWSGSRVINSSEEITPTGVLGDVLTYTLNCGGATDSVTVYIGPVQPNCNIPLLPNSKAVLQPYATPSSANNDLSTGICVLCGAVNVANVTDFNLLNHATISRPVSLLGGSVSITVTDNNNIYRAGSTAGVIMSIPGSTLLTLELVSGLTVETLNSDNVVTGSTTVSNLLDLYLFGFLDLPTAFYQPVTSLAPFNKIRVRDSGVVGVLRDLSVYDMCVQEPSAP